MKSRLPNFDVKGKTVLLRIDGNVPIERTIILDDQRLRAVLPTINTLLHDGATVVLLTHIGRPEHKDPAFSTRPLLSKLEDYGLHVAFAQNPSDVLQKKQEGHQLILMENLRFFPGEKQQDPAFAQQLAALGDFYIDDAFGSLGRSDASLTLLPDLFDAQHKTIGLLVEHELSMLNILKQKIRKPLVLIIGGNKSDKIPLINLALPHVSSVLIGPALAFNFLKSEGKSVGNSSIDNEMLNTCREISMHAQELHVPLLYPVDYIIAQQTFEGTLDEYDYPYIPNGSVGVSIGPKTAALWGSIIMQAKSVVLNGLMGSLSRPESLMYTRDLFMAMAQTDAVTVVAGGDSVAAAHFFDAAPDIDYLSTGGGAALYYLFGIELPALASLENRTEAQ
jgi:3-phosphoglycerate kinase